MLVNQYTRYVSTIPLDSFFLVCIYIKTHNSGTFHRLPLVNQYKA